MLSHTLLATPAWQALSGHGAKLLVQMVRLYNGANNGELFLSERDAAAAIGTARATAGHAFAELGRLGFIRATERGHFARKIKVATSWRLTFHATDKAPPTNEFRDWSD